MEATPKLLGTEEPGVCEETAEKAAQAVSSDQVLSAS